MQKVFIEYRPRLGVANVYISTASSQAGHQNLSKYVCSIEQSNNAIVLAERNENKTDKAICKFLWPDQLGNLCSNETGNQCQGL